MLCSRSSWSRGYPLPASENNCRGIMRYGASMVQAALGRIPEQLPSQMRLPQRSYGLEPEIREQRPETRLTRLQRVKNPRKPVAEKAMGGPDAVIPFHHPTDEDLSVGTPKPALLSRPSALRARNALFFVL